MRSAGRRNIGARNLTRERLREVRQSLDEKLRRCARSCLRSESKSCHAATFSRIVQKIAEDTMGKKPSFIYRKFMTDVFS